MPSWQNLGIIVENKMSETWSFQKNYDSGYQYIFELMSGSSHIQSVLIGIKYRNCCRTLDVFLRFAIWIGQIPSKLLNGLVTNGLDDM